MDICIVCGKEIKDVYMYDSHELFCSDDCKEVNREEEIEECGHCKGKCVMNARRLARMYHE